LSRPGPRTAAVQCTIVRDASASKSYPTYSLYLDDPSKLILAARKRKKSKTSNYIISLDDRVGIVFGQKNPTPTKKFAPETLHI
jgi:hypothetical protein